MEYTSNYKLKKPSAEDFYNIQDFNDNADIIDAKLKVVDETKELADSLTVKESALEAKVAVLQAKSKILLTVLAPAGTNVTLQRSGCPTVSGTVGSSMELDLEVSALGGWEMSYTYQSYSGSKSVEVTQLGKNYVTAAPTLELSPWAYIDKISQAGLASQVYDLGDLKTMQVGEETCKAQIVGFDHDTLSEPSAGRKTAGITFHLQDTLTQSYPMHSDYATHTMWAERDMRTKYLPAIMETLPTELQGIIKTVDKLTTNAGNNAGSNYSLGMTVTQDKLFLPSEWELLGYSYSSPSQYIEGNIYEYYMAGNSIYKTDAYWTRSNSKSNTTSNYAVRCPTSGQTILLRVDLASRIAFMFCV
jgi:hypothetical protein